ncbi:helix-turn-helix domain-containing protein [Nannocystaceae bacterium ST9]
MHESLREIWTTRGDELSQIEFRPALSPEPFTTPIDNLTEAAETWLEGQSAAVERLRSRANTLAREGSAAVLIHGEPGSGKLRTTQWIHRSGKRAARPLLVLDADDPAIERQLDRVIETITRDPSHAPGTVAIRQIERANPATLAQAVRLLGCQGVELICALALLANETPEQVRARSQEHANLLGRVGSAIVAVPALRHRSGDVGELARRFAEIAARRYGKSIRGVSPQALSKLDGHEFPGNVRELASIVEQAVLRSSGDWVTAEAFFGLGESAAVRATDSSELVIRLPGSSLREIEVQALRLALRMSGGRIVRASELLGITRHALRRKLEKFGLNELRAPNDL